jgi:regulator of replication initiation timing
VKQHNSSFSRIRKAGVFSLLVLVASLPGWTQEAGKALPSAASNSLDATVRELADQVHELRAAVNEMRSEAAQYRAETEQLRRELQAAREQMGASTTQPAPAAGAKQIEDRVASLEESAQLLNSKVDDQYQTKVESASKYRVRLSGLALLNLFANRGPFDNTDFPAYVPQSTPFNSSSTFGATMRQSELGLEVFGPALAGAKTSANVQVDFSGGFPSTLNGASYGLVRLRIASMRLDWHDTSVVAGQDNLFVSPNSPTSFASLAIPALAYQGNLWGWTPQVRVEHRFTLQNDQDLVLQAGLLDNLTGEPPFAPYDRLRQAGEASGQPAYGVRVAWIRRLFGQNMTLGTAGYYGRQSWGFSRHVDGWAGMTDWEVPLAPHVSLTGEFYRGRAIGGLGGGIGRSTLYSGSIYDPATRVIGLDSVGGWSQLKFRATSRLEFNGAFGVDNPMASDVRAFPQSVSYADPTLVQNRSAFVNFIYRPRSNLLFSTEYRRLRTYQIDDGSQAAGQVNMIMGVLF